MAHFTVFRGTSPCICLSPYGMEAKKLAYRLGLSAFLVSFDLEYSFVQTPSGRPLSNIPSLGHPHLLSLSVSLSGRQMLVGECQIL